MKVTQEMIDAFNRGTADNGRALPVARGDVFAGLVAVLKVIDPVPEDVGTIEDRDGGEWNRNSEDPMVWICEDGFMCRTYRDIEERWGPITWKDKK